MNLSKPYQPNSAANVTTRMLRALGLNTIEELYNDIPDDAKLNRPLNIPEGKTEGEVERLIEETLRQDLAPEPHQCFLGGGIWTHYVPALVDEVISRSEFYTAYTPYQAEASQGMLQALYEYQSLICDLTGMEIANSSMYDWASAAGEAGRMAVRITRRRKIIALRNCGPQRLDTLKTYCDAAGVDVVVVDYEHKKGCIDYSTLKEKVDDETAAIYFENPNYFGVFEEQAEEICKLAHLKGALAIVGLDPTSLSVVKPPAEYGADIVVGEGQPLGLYPNYGGPLIGIFAARGGQKVFRQMPGRIIGETLSKNGKRRCYTMVMQTREQHIRREEATSNICTNEALCAVAASVYLAMLGSSGLMELGRRIMESSHYAAKKLGEIKNVESPRFTPFFKDFVVRFLQADPEKIYRNLPKYGLVGSQPLGKDFPELSDSALFSATEVHLKKDIDFLIHSVSKEVEDK
ncbi:MAG: aminomethyl-transferring glycine dehydrogenase subunit GcvPA [Nitrososphaerales archaeon]